MPSGQLTLFSVDPRPLAGAEGSADTEQEPAGQAVPAPHDRQIELFAHPVVLARELEVALGRDRRPAPRAAPSEGRPPRGRLQAPAGIASRPSVGDGTPRLPACADGR